MDLNCLLMVRSPQKIAQLLEFRIRPSCNETWSPGTTLPNNLTLMPCLYGGVLSEMNAFLTLLIPRAPCAFNLEVTSRLQLPNVLVVEKAGSRASAIVGVGAACHTVSDSSASGLASGQIGLQAPRSGSDRSFPRCRTENSSSVKIPSFMPRR